MDYSDGQQGDKSRDAGLELVGPYTLIARIAGGDFTSVHLAQKQGALGFHRLAAIKRLKPEFQKQPEWTQLLLDEARLSAIVRHPNIVDIIDVGNAEGVYIVMDYIEGADLDVLIGRAGKERHPRYLVPPIVDALTGLHAVHTAVDELGESLSMVHQAPRARHILIGIDGVSRITDFSQVSARGLIPSTLMGKRLAPGYMAPEQVLLSEPVSARTDVFIAGITLWETLTGAKLFSAESPSLARRAITERHIPRPSEVGLKPPRCFDEIVMKALQRNPAQRYQSALEMANELRDVAVRQGLYANAGELGQWVRALASRALVERRRALGADAPSQEIPLDPIHVKASTQVSVDAGAKPSTSVAKAISVDPPSESVQLPRSVKTPLPNAPVPQPAAEQPSVIVVRTRKNTPLPAPAANAAAALALANRNGKPVSSTTLDEQADAVQPVVTRGTPMTTPRGLPRANASLSKATLMGLSPRPRTEAARVPAPPLSSTLGYDSAPDTASEQQPAPATLAPGEQLVGNIPGRRRPGQLPPNATLPEGSFLRDLNLPAKPPPRRSSSPAYNVGGSYGAGSYAGGSPAKEQSQSYAQAPQYTAPRYDAAPQYTAASQARPQHAEPHAQPASVEVPLPQQDSRERHGSGAFPTPANLSNDYPGVKPLRFPSSDGIVPPDIFARVQAARLQAGESFRPPAYDFDAEFDQQPRSRGGLSSLLFVGGLLAAGFFGYRQFAMQPADGVPAVDPSVNAAGQGLPPEPEAPAAAAPAPVEPTAAEPAQPVAREPAAQPAEPEAVPPPVQFDEPAEQAAEPTHARKPAARAAARAVTRQAPVTRRMVPPYRGPWPGENIAPAPQAPAPRQAPAARQSGAEALPDNPY